MSSLILVPITVLACAGAFVTHKPWVALLALVPIGAWIAVNI